MEVVDDSGRTFVVVIDKVDTVIVDCVVIVVVDVVVKFSMEVVEVVVTGNSVIGKGNFDFAVVVIGVGVVTIDLYIKKNI